MPMSAAPPVSARAKEPGSGATFPPAKELVPLPKLKESTDKLRSATPLKTTVMGDDELLM